MFYVENATGITVSLASIRLRHPEVSIPDEGGDLTFIGYTIAPLPPAPTWGDVGLSPRYWWVDKGPFLDRLDRFGYAGLKDFVLGAARTNDDCYALQADLGIRVYIDLMGRRAELLAAMGRIAAVVAAAGRPEFTLAMQTAVVCSITEEAERHIKGLPQPLEAT